MESRQQSGRQSMNAEHKLRESEFHKTLLRERACSDRNGHGFSVMLFDGNVVTDPVAHKKLIQLLTRRIRQTDQIGEYTQGKIGVILPYTTLIGAKALAQEIWLATMPSPPRCTIYC